MQATWEPESQVYTMRRSDEFIHTFKLCHLTGYSGTRGTHRQSIRFQRFLHRGVRQMFLGVLGSPASNPAEYVGPAFAPIRHAKSGEFVGWLMKESRYVRILDLTTMVFELQF